MVVAQGERQARAVVVGAAAASIVASRTLPRLQVALFPFRLGMLEVVAPRRRMAQRGRIPPSTRARLSRRLGALGSRLVGLARVGAVGRVRSRITEGRAEWASRAQVVAAVVAVGAGQRRSARMVRLGRAVRVVVAVRAGLMLEGLLAVSVVALAGTARPGRQWVLVGVAAVVTPRGQVVWEDCMVGLVLAVDIAPPRVERGSRG